MVGKNLRLITQSFEGIVYYREYKNLSHDAQNNQGVGPSFLMATCANYYEGQGTAIYMVTNWSQKSKDAPIKAGISHQRQSVFYERFKLNRYVEGWLKTDSVQFLNRVRRFESCQGYHFFPSMNSAVSVTSIANYWRPIWGLTEILTAAQLNSCR